jgi:hypothetical protein
MAQKAMEPSAPAERIFVVNLRADGTYRLHDIDELAKREGIDFDHEWLAALLVYRARERKRR